MEKKTGIPVDEQRLMHAGKQLDDDLMLADYTALQNNSTVFLIMQLLGGTYTELVNVDQPVPAGVKRYLICFNTCTCTKFNTDVLQPLMMLQQSSLLRVTRR